MRSDLLLLEDSATPAVVVSAPGQALCGTLTVAPTFHGVLRAAKRFSGSLIVIVCED